MGVDYENRLLGKEVNRNDMPFKYWPPPRIRLLTVQGAVFTTMLTVLNVFLVHNLPILNSLAT